ncbi:hypothetical protein P8452_62339 [Trifolium repens]|nr:hypothetical protein P8452_62339 [Trifolium repens]
MATLEEGEVVVTPDGKDEPINNVENSESQPVKDNCNSEPHPAEELSTSETHGTGGDANVLDNTKPCQNSDLDNSEPLLNNQAANAGAPEDTQPINLEATLNTSMDISEAAPGDQLVGEATLDKRSSPEALPSHQVLDSEAMRNNDVVVSETQHNNEAVVVSETKISNEGVVVSEAQHINEGMVATETCCNDDVVMSESQSSEVVMSDSQQNNEVVISDSNPSSEVAFYDTQPSNENAMREARITNDAVVFDTQPNNGTVMHEAGISNDAAVSDTQPNNETVMHERHISNETVMHEAEINNETVMHDDQISNVTVMHEAVISNDVVASEARSENELANSTIDPNNQLPHQEIILDNHQFANLHMIPEDQLPHPESQPNSESPHSSEPLADGHNTDAEQIPHNHLQEYDTLPNSHLDHHEALANHQLADSETLSHDQLANSQTIAQYDLANSETLHNNQLISSQAHYEIVDANNIPSYEIVNAETPPNNDEYTPEIQPNKRRKKKSIVWEHFTIETVSAECRRACCKQCKQTFAYSTGSKVAGTSHLKRHIAKGACPALLRSLDPDQYGPYTPRSRGSGAGNTSNTPKRRYRTSGAPFIIFDQDRCRDEIARMIIMHDYPLHMVEHPGFVAFVQNLQPQFNMVTFNTVQGDCVATYLVEKQNLMKYFDELPGRVGLTLDMWTSSQSVGFVFITGHFVDSDWKLQRRILNVVMEPYPDSDSALSHAVSVCISDWNLEGRLFTITCNQPLTEVALENLRPLLSVKNPLIFNGQLLIGNCIARTLSNIAYDLLSSEHGVVNKIRESVKYVKSSESHEDKFLDLKQQLQVPSERSLFIDDQTKWNTTYLMLVAASELKEVFSCLDTSDPDYKGTPSFQDWQLVETLCTYLKPLYDAANILMTTTYPTAVTFFHEVWKLHLDLARAVKSEDLFISNLTKPMHEKIDEYWRNCSLALVIAVVMDPRFKMKLVEFSFTKIYGEDAHGYVKIVDDGIHELFDEYATLPLPLTPAYAEEGNAGSNMKVEGSQGGTLLSDNGLTDFDAYIMETSTHQTKSELDQYLEESLLPRVPDFDVLSWWKLNKLKYPTLSKMARDILSIPVSTVPPDSIFDKKSKEMDQYRSSLRPETVEALVCTKDWMQYGAAESLAALVKMEI